VARAALTYSRLTRSQPEIESGVFVAGIAANDDERFDYCLVDMSP
jgi:hypothetical protein